MKAIFLAIVALLLPVSVMVAPSVAGASPATVSSTTHSAIHQDPNEASTVTATFLRENGWRSVSRVAAGPTALVSPSGHSILLEPSPPPPATPCCGGGGGFSYPPSSEYYVENQWIAPNGLNVMYRKGTYDSTTDTGFGMTKVINKHNLFRQDLMGYTVAHGAISRQSNGRWTFTQRFISQYGRYITIFIVATPAVLV